MNGSILTEYFLKKRIAAGEPIFAYAYDGRGVSFRGWFKVRRIVLTSLKTVSGARVYSAAGEYVTGRFVGQTAFALVPCFYTEPVESPVVYAIKGGVRVCTKKA